MRRLCQVVVVVLLGVALAIAGLEAQGSLVANAGPDQSGVFVGDVVALSGAASVGATTYAWALTSRPGGSSAVIQNASTVSPTFVPDKRGSYTVRLTVGNGSATATDTIVVVTANRAPVANAGSDGAAAVTKTVTLSGVASTDPDNDKLTFRWTLVNAPDASQGVLSKATTSKPSLLLDRPGEYTLSLVVRDGQLSSPPDTVIVRTTNTAPVSKAGPDRRIAVGRLVQLDGTASSDIDEDALTYAWTLKRPSGSAATLNDPASPLPGFFADKAGTYTATLTVSDGMVTHKDSVILATSANLKPLARSGPDGRPLTAGATMQLDGSGSTDANGSLQGYAWTVTKRPSGSGAALVGAATPRPTFTADRTGHYTFGLTVTDASLQTGSDPRLFTSALQPVAHAGSDQVVVVGGRVTLDGSGSRHSSGPIAFRWALVSQPSGSSAALDDPTDPQPQFEADLEGTYVVQLTLFDGARFSTADTVAVTTGGNLPPAVDMGPDRLVPTGGPVTVDAVATDPNQDPLTFSWSLLSRPSGSAAALSGVTGAAVQITPDVAGDYIVQVTAEDAGGHSAVDTLLITTGNTAPSVVAEGDRLAAAGVTVVAAAAASDADGDALSYEWTLLSLPAGSTAALDNPSSPTPSFTPDIPGAYLVQVVVRDGTNLFSTDAVVYRVPTEINGRPVADAGDDQTVAVGGLAQLDGSASSDPENQVLSYAWAFASRPLGSSASLSSTTAVNPTFMPDVAGEYELALIVNDGVQDSVADTMLVRTLLDLKLDPTALEVAHGGNGLLTLSIAYAPANDLVVPLVSSDATIASVPASVTIPAGETTAAVTVTGGAATGGAIVTASMPGVIEAHATVAVGARLVRWTDDVSGFWHHATNWTDDIAPGPGDVVVIDRPAGSFEITIVTPTAAVASVHATERLNIHNPLTVNGAAVFDGGVDLVNSGALGGTGRATVNSAMTWSGGPVSLAQGLDIAFGHTLTLMENHQSQSWNLVGTTLRNYGTVAMATGTLLRLQGGTTTAVINTAGALWTMGFGAISSIGAGALTFANAGTFRITDLSGAQMWGQVAYTNTGTIDVERGALAVGGGASLLNTGQLHTGTGATIFLDAVTLGAGSTLTGSGMLEMNGTLLVETDLTTATSAHITGVVSGSGALRIAGDLRWRIGTVSLAGGLEILPAGRLTFPNDGFRRELEDSTLTNRGTVDMGAFGNSLRLQGAAASVVNAAGALWTAGSGVFTSAGDGIFTVVNAGTLRNVGPGDIGLMGAVDYTSTGTIDIVGGRVVVAAVGTKTLTTSGHISVAAGASFPLSDVTLAAGSTFSGSGTLPMNGVTTVTADLPIPLPVVLDGTLTGSGSVRMAADMTWLGSGYVSLDGELEIGAGRTLTLPPVFFTIGLGPGTTLRTFGNVTWPDGGIIRFDGNDTAIVNEGSGVWTLGAGAQTVSFGGGPPKPTFVNAGTLQGQGVASTTLIVGNGVSFSNTGTITGITLIVP